jgi:hypothetical protein
MQALENELLESLSNQPPLVIVMTAEEWPFGIKVFEVIEKEKRWNDFFSNFYRISKDSERYRIYARTH